MRVPQRGVSELRQDDKGINTEATAKWHVRRGLQSQSPGSMTRAFGRGRPPVGQQSPGGPRGACVGESVAVEMGDQLLTEELIR